MSIPEWVRLLDEELEKEETKLLASARKLGHYKDNTTKALYNIEASTYARIRRKLVQAAEAASSSPDSPDAEEVDRPTRP